MQSAPRCNRVYLSRNTQRREVAGIGPALAYAYWTGRRKQELQQVAPYLRAQHTHRGSVGTAPVGCPSYETRRSRRAGQAGPKSTSYIQRVGARARVSMRELSGTSDSATEVGAANFDASTTSAPLSHAF